MRFDRPLDVINLNFFYAPDGRQCGGVRGGGLGERWGRMGGVGARR